MNDHAVGGLEDYLDTLPDKIEAMEALLLQLNQAGGRAKAWEEFLRVVHSVKGGAGSFGLNFVATICHHFETYLASTGPGALDVDFSLRFVDLLDEYITQYRQDWRRVDEEAYVERLRQLLPTREVARFRVLVVENTAAMSEYYAKTLLEKSEVSVAYEKSGIGALAQLMKEEFDVLLTSMYVGDLDGPSLIAALKVTRGPNRSIPTVLITSDVEKAYSHTGFGADFVLRKSQSLHDDLLAIYGDIFNRNFFVGLVPQRPRGELRRILCVDDDEMIFALVKIGLKKLTQPVELAHADSGQKAIAGLPDFQPDLILMDVMMPGLDGPATLREVRDNRETADIPVIFLTGQDERSDINALLDLGVLGVIRKPFDNKKLAGYVETIWRLKC